MSLDTDKLMRVAYGMEQFMMSWDEIPWHEVPEPMREFKDEDGPVGAGKHPKFGWFVLFAGQGTCLAWCETDTETLMREFDDYRPLGGKTPPKD